MGICKGQFIIAEILNSSYDQVKTALGIAPESLSSETTPNFTIIEGLRDNPTLKNAHITTYKYRPSVGVTEMKNSTGFSTYYNYDSSGRLKESYIYEKNASGADEKKVVQSYDYHYQNQ